MRQGNPSQWVLPVVAVALLVGVAGLALHLRNEALERRMRNARDRQRAQEQLAVEQELRRVKGLGEERKAEEIWDFWLRIKVENWEYECEHERELMAEMLELGDVAFDLLVRKVREGSSGEAHEAASQVWRFGPKAIAALVESLQIDNEETQHAVLIGLWECLVQIEMTEGDRRRVQEAVTPFRDNPDEALREWAEIVLKQLGD